MKKIWEPKKELFVPAAECWQQSPAGISLRRCFSSKEMPFPDSPHPLLTGEADDISHPMPPDLLHTWQCPMGLMPGETHCRAIRSRGSCVSNPFLPLEHSEMWTFYLSLMRPEIADTLSTHVNLMLYIKHARQVSTGFYTNTQAELL